VVYNLWWQRNIIRLDSSLQGEEKPALASVELKAKVKTLLSICNFFFFLFVILQLLFCFPFPSVELKAKVREKMLLFVRFFGVWLSMFWFNCGALAWGWGCLNLPWFLDRFCCLLCNLGSLFGQPFGFGCLIC
jgi:hypothetical protein